MGDREQAHTLCLPTNPKGRVPHKGPEFDGVSGGRRGPREGSELSYQLSDRIFSGPPEPP